MQQKRQGKKLRGKIVYLFVPLYLSHGRFPNRGHQGSFLGKLKTDCHGTTKTKEKKMRK